MPAEVTTRSTTATDHVTFVNEADTLTETQYGLYGALSSVFPAVAANNWGRNDNPDLDPPANTDYNLFSVALEGGGTESLFSLLDPNITTASGPLTDGTGLITNPENLFDYFVETQITGTPDSWDALLTQYKEFVKGLVRTDLDGDDLVFVETFELYGETIQKYLPDDGDSSTPRALSVTPMSTQVQNAIDRIFEGGEADYIDEIKDIAEDAFKQHFGPDGFDPFSEQVGLSFSQVYGRAEEHFFTNCFGPAASPTVPALLDGWLDFVAPTATAAKGDDSTAPWDNLPNMWDSFDTLVGGDTELFGDLLRSFIRNEAWATDGYFLPTEHLAEWQAFLANPDVQADPKAVVNSVLDCPPPPEHRRMDMILVEILDLITVVLQRLEGTAVIQSQANFLSQDIQRKYTELISQVQLKDTSSIDTSDTQELEELKSDNEIVQKRLEDLRNARTTVRDAGTELTDALKATNDNIEQQSQLGSSVIQQLGELIRAIFR